MEPKSGVKTSEWKLVAICMAAFVAVIIFGVWQRLSVEQIVQLLEQLKWPVGAVVGYTVSRSVVKRSNGNNEGVA